MGALHRLLGMDGEILEGLTAACLVVLSPVLALWHVSGSRCAGMGIKLFCPCMRSCCMGGQLCRAALQKLRVLLIIPPGSALPSTDALNEALCLLLLELSGSLCSTKWLVMLCHARQTCLQCSRSLCKKSEKIVLDSPGWSYNWAPGC